MPACTQPRRFTPANIDLLTCQYAGQQAASGEKQTRHPSKNCPAVTAELCRAPLCRTRSRLSPGVQAASSKPQHRQGSSLTCILPELCPAWDVDDIGGQDRICVSQRDAADKPRPRTPALLLRGLKNLFNVAADIPSVRPPPAKFILPFPHRHCRGVAAVPQGRTRESGWPCRTASRSLSCCHVPP